ncbi:MAG: alpha/beta hydrolase [Alphaproteobacteria bacterium]|nr:alpha/beta hydrolase [Alphaproteobacteria bacterium]
MPGRMALDLVRFQADVAWATGEWGSKLLAEPFLRQICPMGDGWHPVLTIPGFAGPEVTLRPLNRFLNAQGFRAIGWGQGTNRGPRSAAHLDRMTERVVKKIERLADIHERKVSLIGQSLGGIYAREVARAAPDLVDRVITLGSPAYLGANRIMTINKLVDSVARFSTGKSHDEHAELARLTEIHKAPPKVPLVSIFSALDGVVAPEAALIPSTDLQQSDGVPRENIEILGSHCGMGVAPIALLAITDRLTVDPAHWRPFDPDLYLKGPLRFLSFLAYPRRARDVASQMFPEDGPISVA